MSTFAKLSGTFLVMASRCVCRACYHKGLRGEPSWVIDPRRCPDFGGPLDARWHRAIARAATKHYAAEHPEVKLP